jgi:hypothetical protein
MIASWERVEILAVGGIIKSLSHFLLHNSGYSHPSNVTDFLVLLPYMV